MATVHEMREVEVHRLAEFKRQNPTGEDIAEARSLMNSFYRLCGLCDRNVILANTERTCNLRSTHASEERERQWFQRLDVKFQELYGLCLTYCGYLPSIGTKSKGGGFAEKITRHFYD